MICTAIICSLKFSMVVILRKIKKSIKEHDIIMRYCGLIGPNSSIRPDKAIGLNGLIISLNMTGSLEPMSLPMYHVFSLVKI